MAFDIESPSPVPPFLEFLVASTLTKGSKISPSNSSGIPTPSSSIIITAFPSAIKSLMLIVIPGLLYLILFSIMLLKALSKFFLSNEISTSSSVISNSIFHTHFAPSWEHSLQ